MSNIGKITWTDLTVDDATGLKDFYQNVCGWGVEEADMGDYNDYSMTDQNGDVVTGICHRKGGNQKIPPVWMPYVTIESLSKSIEYVTANGGKIIDGPKKLMGGKMALIEDPAGAKITLFEEG